MSKRSGGCWRRQSRSSTSAPGGCWRRRPRRRAAAGSWPCRRRRGSPRARPRAAIRSRRCAGRARAPIKSGALRRLAQELQARGHHVGRTLVAELLDGMGYPLQVNRKTRAGDDPPSTNHRGSVSDVARGQFRVSLDSSRGGSLRLSGPCTAAWPCGAWASNRAPAIRRAPSPHPVGRFPSGELR